MPFLDLSHVKRLTLNAYDSATLAELAPVVEGKPDFGKLTEIDLADLARHHIWEAIRFENTEALAPVFDNERPIRGTADMPIWYTGRPCEKTKRSHISHCVFDSRWEASEAFELDRNKHVTAWAKNEHLGFEVLYTYKGVIYKYRPDFLVRLVNGLMLILEVKGQDSPKDRTKREFLDEWVRCVNEQGGFGRWAPDISWLPADVKDILKKHGAG